MNAIFNILSLAFWYGFVWKKVAHLLGVRYISIADLLASAKTKVVAAVDNLDPNTVASPTRCAVFLRASLVSWPSIISSQREGIFWTMPSASSLLSCSLWG